MAPRDAASAARAEFRLFARYLINEAPSPEMEERYTRAVRTLFPKEQPSAALCFARRHPAALGMLDAACGLRRPEDPLRKRLLTAAAILEAAPDYADEFLPEAEGRTRLIAGLGVNGMRALAKAAAGIVLLAVIAR